ncbi:hypothetical protein BCE02nite_61550 [Brevibacillus centrosporus]|uniref:helix-turn-helix domain-containing protein n=1 Tax=Brevibacillus centrosporus TaxID=54910 RepID=UPI000F0A176B|nr:helix-turn-helix transcriptional regulator [Brevibacillus centrosporus]RNB68552.1 helix-turn-helix domain-containing protein [Brevibacillus centrosporus]GED35014.1 hypothetical protein BCE02nite_61550 [Brevibacillus centrosporus]
MFGLGKQRSKLGKWLDRRGVKQKWLAKEAELNKATITRVTSSDEYTPNLRTIKKILQALRKIDPNVKQDDFWTM